jgi:CBS domain-containing protein
MPQTIEQVMTSDPICLPPSASVHEAAQQMQDRDIGAVIVTSDDQISGIVTDRDIVVRAVARGADPDETQLSEVCSDATATLAPDDTIEDAIQEMRQAAVRRVPVVRDGKPVGVVSIGDLATARDEKSALADISGQAPNN